MNPKIPFCFLLCLLLGALSGSAQDQSNIKFNNVTVKDFEPGKPLDSSASAVIIADIGCSYFEGNTKGWFTLVFEHKRRMKILNKNGFDAANIEIPLYMDGTSKERLEKLKAVTYNLEGKKVIESRLDNKSIYTDVKSKHLAIQKFTFPAVKEGSVIEYSYTVTSDFLFNLQPWGFQSKYPCYWSEYEVRVPEFFDYVFLMQGFHPFHINTRKSAFKTFNIIEPGDVGARRSSHSISGNVAVNRWVIKDILPLREENYTSTLDNHISKIEFQLSRYRFPNSPVREILGNWSKVNEELMKNVDFGATLFKNNNWLDDDLRQVTLAATDKVANARSIYRFVRDNFTCTGYNGTRLNNSLKNIMKTRNGSVAEINLLLCAMLRHENMEANPVLLSTRSHGYTHEIYPLLNRFNYVVCEVNLDGKRFYLDASHPDLGFARLPLACYNGHARVLGDAPRPVYFRADSLVESKVIFVQMFQDKQSGGIVGKYEFRPGYYESQDIRRKIREKGQESFFKAISSSLDFMTIESPVVDSLKDKEKPVMVHYDFKLNTGADMLYFNPLLKDGYKENIFKATDRKYPVEMPFALNEVYILNMEIPEGYQVEEIPKSVRVSFNEGEGLFEYIIRKDAGRIQLRSTVALKKASFLPKEYEPLRGFFGEIVKKHNEQIVFKKTVK